MVAQLMAVSWPCSSRGAAAVAATDPVSARAAGSQRPATARAPRRGMSVAPLLLALAVLLSGVCRCNANPGLLSAISRDPTKFTMVFDGMALDSMFISSGDLGVKHFNFSFAMSNPVYPHSPPQLNIRLHVFAKYMVADGIATIKAFMSAETRDIAKTPPNLYVQINFHMASLAGDPMQRNHSFKASAAVHSYWDPPAQAAMVYGFEAKLPLGSQWAEASHIWQLTTNVDPTVWHWAPAQDLNLLDGRGVFVPPVLPSEGMARETFVVLKPLYNFSTYLFGPLIFRHVEYYQSMGVSKHIIYLRKESIPALLLGNPKVAKLVQKGKIVLIVWDSLPQHDLWSRRYDQRVVYSHAVLAFTGMDVYLMNIDLDEYLVSTVPELQNQPVQKLIHACAGHPAEARVMRYHTLCKDCDHSRPEAFLWGAAAAEQWPRQHPLSWYHLTNYVAQPAGKSIINPNFLRAFYIHWGSPAPGFNTSYPPGKCMFFLHVAHMLQASIPSSKVKHQFIEDKSWMGTLQHVKQMHFPPEPPRPPLPPPPSLRPSPPKPSPSPPPRPPSQKWA